MKHLIILISALIFSTLFFKQDIGLNLSIFTILTIVISILKHPLKIKNKDTIGKAIFYLISGITVFLYKSNLSIITNIIAFFTFIGSVSEHKSSIYIQWINGVYTTIVAYFSMHFDELNIEVKNVKKEKINYTYWFKIITIPTLIIVVFINLYSNANPKFNELISKIDFSFINFQWLLFTALGYYLFHNITNPIQIEPVTLNDIELGNILEKKDLKDIAPKKLKEEKQLGTVMVLLLNVLIVFFIITYVMHLSEIHNMLAPQLSEQVHNGVNALILSNVLAIIIILYFFRGSLNFMEDVKTLKNLTFTWIFLNISIVLITVIINLEYIVSFGFTYKRIGVLFFLTITSIGLITTFIKVSKIKNLWYLFRKNLQIAFTLLIISSTVNWDKTITYYNINFANQMDLNYLINLSNNNAFILKDYIEKNNIDNSKVIKINNKHNEYIQDLNDNSWQEMVYDNLKIKK